MCDETMMRYVFKKQTKNRQTLDLYAQVFGLADRSLIDNIWTLDWVQAELGPYIQIDNFFLSCYNFSVS